MHYAATYDIYQVGLGLPPNVVQGRLFQDAFYVFAFATAGIVVAVWFNWRNSRLGFWLNAAQVGLADVPFILFVIVPGYVPFWMGVTGPVVWIAAVIMTGLNQMRHSTSVRAVV